MPMLLPINPKGGKLLWLPWVSNVSVISTSNADLPWGHRAESCFNYPGFPLSHCHCGAPGATLPCGAESPYRGGDDNSDNGSTCWADARRVPYGKLNQSHCLSDSLVAFSCLLLAVLSSSHVRAGSWIKPAAAWKTEHGATERELLGCHRFPVCTGTIRLTLRVAYMRWGENHTFSTWLLHFHAAPKRIPQIESVILGQLFPSCDSANSQLVDSSLPAVHSHRHWLHVNLNEAPQWLWKHTAMVGYTLSTDQLCCVKDHRLLMTLNHRCCLSFLWWRFVNITAATFPNRILSYKSPKCKYWEKQLNRAYAIFFSSRKSC